MILALIMEAVRTSETLVHLNEITRRYIPEGYHLLITRYSSLLELLVFDFLFEVLEMFLCLLVSLYESCPTTGSVSAANTVCRSADIFREQLLS
jgi:hypothetical protein